MSEEAVTIVGLPLAELQELITKNYPHLNVKRSAPAGVVPGGDVHVFKALPRDAELEKLSNEKNALSEQSAKALKSIQTFHQQQQALFDEFVVLRQKYDDQKNSLISTLWIHCGEFHPDLVDIPKAEGKDFVETEKQVGEYRVDEPLGEGQFASVFTCYKGNTETELAIKVIKKDRITSFTSLRRVSTEIATLKKLVDSDYIVRIIQVIQTATKLYIVTEKGGTDLFEFFDEHAEGVPESWAIEIISGVMEAVLFCHQHSICHRDLKPENILLKFDTEAGRCVDLKLCDFGLSTEFSKKEPLSDFCGSPGFFAPEMLSIGQYYGDKADVWSTGCILLELVLGHDRFCTTWMGAYDYSVMQDREHFQREISVTVDSLPEELDFSANLNDILIQFLQLDPVIRSSCAGLCQHPWFGDRFTRILAEMQSPVSGKYGSGRASWRQGLTAGQSPAPIVTVSDRERRFMEGRKRLEEDDKESDNAEPHMLPPIEPATPSINKARKMLFSGGGSEVSPKKSPANSAMKKSSMKLVSQTAEDTIHEHEDMDDESLSNTSRSKSMNSGMG